MDLKTLHWSLQGVSIKRAEVKDDRLTLHLNSGKTLVVSGVCLHYDYGISTDEWSAA